MTKTEVHDALCVLRRPDEPDSPDNYLLRRVLENDAVLREYRSGEIIACPPTPTEARRYCAAIASSLTISDQFGSDYGTVMFNGELVYAS